jgi:hypothetical protein
MFVVTGRGFYRNNDAGLNWTFINVVKASTEAKAGTWASNGLPATFIEHLTIDPASPATLCRDRFGRI